MAEMSERLPLAVESTDLIRARMTRDTVAGWDPSDSGYPDVVPGAILDDWHGAVSLEIDRVYDRVHNELPASVLPSTTTGEWLDDWADSLGLVRKDETYASGFVTFTVDAAPEGSPATEAVDIPLGGEVAAPSPAAGTDELGYATTASGTIPAGGGSLTLPVVALAAGALLNVPANAVQILETDRKVSRVTNTEPITGGADVEDDASLRARILLKLSGAGGAGNVTDYTNWSLSEPGVGGVTVQPNWAGPGSVRVVIVTTSGDAAGPELIGRLQEKLDPPEGAGPGGTGNGLGLAPIGATVTVATPDVVLFGITYTIRPEAGYSLDGAGGTRTLAALILRSVSAYVATLRTGRPVLWNKVLAAIVDVEGVDDCTSLGIDGASGDLVVGPLEIPRLDPTAVDGED